MEDRKKFFGLLDELLDSQRFPGLDRDHMKRDGLSTQLPHRSGYGINADLSESGGTLFYYLADSGSDHLDFSRDHWDSFIRWPDGADDWVEAMVGVIGWFLTGAITVDVRFKWSGASVRTYLLTDDEWLLCQRSWYAAWARPSRSRTVRFDYTRT